MKKLKKRKKDFMANVKFFSAVMKHPEFTKDPLATISTHVENKVASEVLAREKEERTEV